MNGPGKRFRIAFSFAGEKREFVGEVARILAARFGKAAILYDKFHEAEFARHDLGIYLPKLYSEQAELLVPVLCPKYDPKRWTGWEWVHIYSLLTKADGHRVMPCRFEHASADGLAAAAGFIELDDKTPEQTATLILQRLALNKGEPEEFYLQPTTPEASRASTSIPNNLPRLQPFFGREKELAAIREALDPENRTWGALIDGPGGMGKTSLAVKAAYNVPVGAFERIIFVSIKDREMDDDGVRRLTGLIIPGFLEMLNELARELGRPEIAKSAEDERIRLLLGVLRPARALLILDNLESLTKADRDQLFTFVKRLPQGCKAILTSRGRIGSGSEELILEQLDQEAALATLADLARHNKLLARTSEAERITLYTQTAGKPLLLRWVAGQLGRGSCRSFPDALEFLRTCPPENDPLEFVFGDLVDDFSIEETSVLAALTYFSLPAGPEHVGELASLDEEKTISALRSLANRSLVVPDQEEENFTLVPLVADFLRRKRPEVVAETGDRLEKRAYALIVENGYQKHERFPVLDAAWPSIAPALPLFAGGPNDRLQTVCSALSDFLDFTGRWDERLSLSQQAEGRAAAAGDYRSAGWRAYDAGWVYNLRQQADQVLACAARAAEHWERASAGARERAVAFQLRGLGHQLRRDYAAAAVAYREVLELDRSRSAESRDVVSDLNDLADIQFRLGDYEAAEQGYREALRVARTIDFAEGVATCTSNLAGLALDRQNWREAEKLAREALPLAETVGRQETIAQVNCHLAAALVNQANGAEALIYARRAVDMHTQLGSPHLAYALATLRQCEG